MPTIEITTQRFTPVLAGLFGSGTTITEITSPKAVSAPLVSAFFANSEGEVRFAMNCDVKVANSLGAALAMIPPGGAEDASADGVVPENIAENLHEVLNICSATFAEYDGQRIVLKTVVLPGDEMPEAFAERLKAAEILLQVNCEIKRYQPGVISLLRLA